MASPTLRQMLLAAVRVLGWLIRYNSALRDAGHKEGHWMAAMNVSGGQKRQAA